MPTPWVVAEVKSRSGKRVVSVPPQLALWLERHRADQQAERVHAGDLWREGGWIFTMPTGKPLDPRADYQEWRDLLTASEVRPARLHDARHTAATVLMVILRVPVRAAMDIMGWSEASMATRYSHMPDELRHEYAGQVGGLLWTAEEVGEGQLGQDHRETLEQLAATLPEPWRTRVTELLRPNDDGLSGALVPD